MKTVLITGCSSGVGFEAALAFARAGDRVYASMRSTSKGRALAQAADGAGLLLNIVELDVTRSETIDACVSDIIAESGRLDVLVNNAAILSIGAFEDIAEAKFREMMETNFFGPAMLTRAVLPSMRRQKSGYIIMISSLSGIASRPGDAVYAASKFALEGLTEGIRHEVDRWNIKTALVEAGQIATNLFDRASLPAASARSPYKALNEWLVDGLAKNARSGSSPRVVAELLVEISRSDGDRLRWSADMTAERVAEAIFAQSDRERDEFLRGVSGIDWWSDGRIEP